MVTGAYGYGALFGTISLNNNGGEDAYVAKLSGDNGDVMWAQGLGGTGRDFGRSVAVSMNITGTGAGDVYISGGDNGTSTYFLAKYSVGGTQDWVKQVTSGAYPSTVTSVAVDSSTGSVFTTGSNFTQKSDSNGNVLWAKGIIGYDITVDSTGNTYITGGFSGKRDFDPGSGKLILTSAGGSDVHVTKLDQNGNLGWATRIGGKGEDEGRNIALDSANNVYVAGHFSGKVDFNPGTGTSYLTSVGSRDIFAVKLDSGANLVWAGSLSGTVDEWIRGMAVDSSDNVLLTGYFSGAVDADPSSAAYNLTSNGGYDSFLVKWTQPVALMASSSVTDNTELLAMASPANAEAVSSRRNEKKEAAHLMDAVFSVAPGLLWYPTFSDRVSIGLLDWDSLDLLGS